MFQYNPTVNNISGQIYGQGLERAAAYNADAIRAQAEADLIRAQRRHQAIMDGAGLVGDIAKTAVGFATGGPAGAAMAGGGGGGGADDSVIASFVNSYANNKALEAKGTAYGDFMKRHGDQLGFDPEWIKGFLSESPRQQAMIGDSIIGMQNTGRSLMSQQIVDMQMNRGGSPGSGGGAGSSAGGMVRVPFGS